MPRNTATNPRYFVSKAEFGAWLREFHLVERELWVGFHKRGTGRPSLTWPESVDEALCVGWIDGLRKRLNDDSYVIRFTPRKPTSAWSSVNIRRITELKRRGRVLPAGLKAFANRSEKKSGIYSYEQRNAAKLGDQFERLFRSNTNAWTFFQSQALWYRRTATWYVVSAKREETRRKRLAALIKACEESRPIAELRHARVSKPRTS